MLNRSHPQSPRAERWIVGIALHEPDRLIEMVDRVQPQHFFDPHLRRLYVFLQKRLQNNEPMDLASITVDVAQHPDRCKWLCGPGDVVELESDAPSAAALDHYISVLHDAWLRRHLVDEAHRLLGLAHKEEVRHRGQTLYGDDPLQVADEAAHRLAALSDGLLGRQVVTLGEAVDELVEEVEAISSRQELPALPTAIDPLDELTDGGARPGELWIIGARPSVGKTALALQWCVHWGGVLGRPVLVISAEMRRMGLAARVVTQTTRIPKRALRRGDLTQDQWDKLVEAQDTMRPWPVYLDDRHGASLARMRSTARSLQVQHGLSAVFVDYLQLLRDCRKSRSRLDGTSDAITACKDLAKDLGVPVVVLSQLNRSSAKEQRRPRMDDLRDSGQIEQDADVVVLLHRDLDVPDRAELIVAKNREAKTDTIPCRFLGSLGVFRAVVTPRALGAPPTPARPSARGGAVGGGS